MSKPSQNEGLAVFAALAVTGLVFLGSYVRPISGGFFSGPEEKPVVLVNSRTQTAAAGEALRDAMSPSGALMKLVVEDVVIGSGEEVKEGDVVSAHYIGTLDDGTVFDNSYVKGKSLAFKVGAGDVIEGWDEGFIGMKTGGKRILVIPPEKAYGDRAVGPIPPNSTLIFSVELIEVN